VLVPPDESETLDGLSERLSPAGDPVEDKVTVPAKLFKLFSEIVEVEVEPAPMLREAGLAEMLKSGEADMVLRNSVIGVALASFEARLARFQFASTVFNCE
jgi:hypothetical protein